MQRLPTATIAVLVLALVLLIAPRSFVAGALGYLRPAETPRLDAAPRADILLETGYPAALFAGTGDRVVAPVYAAGAGYRHDLAIAQGSDRGIRAGDVATLPAAQEEPVPTFVGLVREAREARATLQTLADPEWRSAVRIGTSSVDALLVGGLAPTLTLISKGAPVAPGDAVVSADESLPYGLFVGSVAEVRDASDGVLREATIALPYTLTGLRAVDVLATGDARQ